MNKLVGCISVFNEAELIEQCLRSTLRVADEVIVVDGPYADYPHDSCSSTDGTLETVGKLMGETGKPITLVTKNSAWLSQMEKRNAYVKLVDEGDLMLVIDGDQQPLLLSGARDRIRVSDAIGFLPEKVQQGPKGALNIRLGNPRIVRKCCGVHYALNHYTLLDRDGRIIYFPPYRLEAMYDCFKILDSHNFKDGERSQANVEYYERRIERSNGVEKFVCEGCQTFFSLSIGDIVKCPSCGKNGGAAYPEELLVA